MPRRTPKALFLASTVAEHQITDRQARIFVLIQYAVNLAGDRHLQAHFGRAIVNAAGGPDAFRYHGHAAHDRRQSFAPAEPLADLAISAMWTDASGDEIAQA